MTKEEFIAAIGVIEVVSERALRISSVEDADRCISSMAAIDSACHTSLGMIRQVLREHIFLKMKEAVAYEKGSGKKEGVYAIGFSDGAVKIGRTRNYQQRFGMISNQSACPVTQNRFFQCERSSDVEAMAHRNFAGSRLKNEFFKVGFLEACEFLEFATSSRHPCSAVN